MEDLEAFAILNELAGDLERMTDLDARDDMLFIYKWEPPDWIVSGDLMARSPQKNRVEAYQAYTKLLEMAAAVRWAINHVKVD